MRKKRRVKVTLVLFLILGVSSASFLVLYALRQNINLFYTPSQVQSANLTSTHIFRLGGLVEKGSVHFTQDGKEVRFTLTDRKQQIQVVFYGLLPDLFREGQGIVAQGKLNQQGQFIADEVLAKHDENYRPPGMSFEKKTS